MATNGFKQYFKLNEQGQDFIVGDIHGQYLGLMTQLEDVGFNAQVDRLFSCGDLIDRGPQSPQCLALIDKPWFFPVIGNHEEFMMLGLAQPYSMDFNLWRASGGNWVEQGNNLAFAQRYLNKVEDLPSVIEVEVHHNNRLNKVGIIHADCPVDDWQQISGKPEQRDSYLWSRSSIKHYLRNPQSIKPVANIDMVVHGHTIVNNLVVAQNRIYIDLGAANGLTPPKVFLISELLEQVERLDTII